MHQGHTRSDNVHRRRIPLAMLEFACSILHDGPDAFSAHACASARRPAAPAGPRPLDARTAAHLPRRPARDRQRRARRAGRGHVEVERASPAPAPVRHAVRPSLGTGARAPCPAPRRPLRSRGRARPDHSRAGAARMRRHGRVTVVSPSRRWRAPVACVARPGRVGVAQVSRRRRVPVANAAHHRRVCRETPRSSQFGKHRRDRAPRLPRPAAFARPWA